MLGFGLFVVKAHQIERRDDAIARIRALYYRLQNGELR
jgi:hypothetical protein